MAASGEAGTSKKRMATYGKAFRKRPPDHAAFKTFQELGSPPMAPRVASISTLVAGNMKTKISPSPSSTTSASMDMFDVPSSDDDANITPQKKRKIMRPARASSVELSKDNPATNRFHPQYNIHKDVIKLSSNVTTAGDQSSGHQNEQRRRAKPAQKIHSPMRSSHTSVNSANPNEKGSLASGMDSFKKIKSNLGISTEIHKQNDSRYMAVTTSQSSTPDLKSSKAHAGTSTPPHKSLPSNTEKRLSSPVTPTTGSDEAVNATNTLSTPTVLTPKGMKMWHGLLGEESEDFLAMAKSKGLSGQTQQPRKAHQNTARNLRQRRRKLIDSLVEQSTNPRPALTLYFDQEEPDSMELDLVPESQGNRGQDACATEAGGVKTDLLKTNAPSMVANVSQNSQVSGAKITYSRQRSMLAEQDLAKEMSFDTPLNMGIHATKLQNHRSMIPEAASHQHFHEKKEIDDGASGVAIRTIHELRQAGAQSRFKDEVEDMLDRIGAPFPQNSSRRSALMDLAGKMSDKMFYTNFLSNGMDQRLFLHLGQEQDVIAGFLIMSLLIVILDTGITPIAIVQLRRQGISRLLLRLINVEDSILSVAKDRKTNMSKSAQASLAEREKSLLQLRVWDGIRPQSISPRSASLRCLELMVRQSREAGNTEDILSKELMSKLFAIVKASCNDDLLETETIDFQLALSTLEAHSLNPMVGSQEHLPIIRDLLERTLERPSESSTIALLLSLVLNTTTNSPTASDVFASPQLLHLMCHAIIEKFRLLSGPVLEAERPVFVNQLVLVLVVMINIAELSMTTPQSFLGFDDSSLGDLVFIFLDNNERAFEANSVEDSHLNVAGGYLAVLLGYLSLSSDIERCIETRQGVKILQPLIACIDEFISHHKKVDDLCKNEGEHNPQAGLTDRLQKLVDMLKEKGRT